MRRFPTTVVIVIVSIVGLVAGWRIFAPIERARFQAVDRVRTSQSYIKLVLVVDYPAGRIARETYTLVDDNGRSSAAYAVADRRGTVATFRDVIRGYDVSFAFDKLVQDGIWQLNSKHRRAADEVGYTVSIDQIAQAQRGSRRVTFTNPEYWAKAAGRQYHIRLDPKKPTPTQADLLRLDSTSNADPRYLRIVDDFRSFGSAGFKRTIASARAKLLQS